MVTSDHTGFVAGNVSFSALGAANAVLVIIIARRLGLGRRAALLSSGFYAVWLSAAGPEISDRLEPLGTVAFLLSLLLLSTPTPSVRPPWSRAVLAAGAALGYAVAVKIWWVAPLLVLVAWQAFGERNRRVAGRLVLGSSASMILVLGPFFAAAPGPMWRMIVTDQLGRHAGDRRLAKRVFDLSSFDQPAGGHTVRIAVTLLVSLVALTLGIAAWRQRSARAVVLVAGVQADPPAQERPLADVLRYLRSGDALIVIRTSTGLSRATRKELRSLPVLARSGRLVV